MDYQKKYLKYKKKYQNAKKLYGGIVEEQVVEEPVIEEPVIEEPVVGGPVVEEQVVEKPVVGEPVVGEPVVEEQVVEKPVVGEPVLEEQVVEEKKDEQIVEEEETEDDTNEINILELMEILKNKMKKNKAKDINNNNSREYEPELTKFLNAYQQYEEVLLFDKDCRKKEFKESLECFIKSKLKIKKNKKTSCSKDALDNENTFMNIFNTDIKYRKNFLNLLGFFYEEEEEYNDYVAEKPKNVIESKEWSNLKIGTKGKTTPKTDIVIKHKTSDYIKGISIKSGVGRITSGDKYETNALFRSVLNNSEKYKNDEELNKLVDELFENMSGVKYVVEDKNITFTRIKDFSSGKILPMTEEEKNSLEWFYEKQKEYKKCNEIWKKIRENHKDYCVDIIKEGFQGKFKFGENIGKADILLTLKGCSTDIKSVLHFVDELTFDKYANEMFNNTALKGNVFATKSASDKKGIRKFWTRFL